jgi:hypothetical protein
MSNAPMSRQSKLTKELPIANENNKYDYGWNVFGEEIPNWRFFSFKLRFVNDHAKYENLNKKMQGDFKGNEFLCFSEV